MNKLYFISVLIFLIIPFISADVAIPLLPLGIEYGILLLIPIIIVETLIGYFLVKRIYKFAVSFGILFLIFSIMNIITYFVGFLLMSYFQFNVLEQGSSGISGNSAPLIFENLFILKYLFLLILTSVIEWPGIYFGIKKKTENPWVKSMYISLLVNLVSYILMLLFFIIKFS